MKNSRIIMMALLLVMCSLISFESLGQRRQGPPPWAPAKGYRAQARYIYFPEHNFYYDHHNSHYIYSDGPDWNRASALPALYAWIDLGNSVQVEMEFNGNSPYRENHYHQEKHHHKHHHKAWKKQHKEWEKGEKEWEKEYEKRHKKCGSRCRDYRYAEEEERRPEKPRGRVNVELRF